MQDSFTSSPPGTESAFAFLMNQAALTTARPAIGSQQAPASHHPPLKASTRHSKTLESDGALRHFQTTVQKIRAGLSVRAFNRCLGNERAVALLSKEPKEFAMQYVLTFNQTAEEFDRLADPVTGPAALEPWKLYMDALWGAGVVRSGSRLLPPWTATTVRLRDGVRQIHDGPFAETKEMAAGFVVIEVPSLDEALRWAEKSPSSLFGSTEVRPVLMTPQ